MVQRAQKKAGRSPPSLCLSPVLFLDNPGIRSVFRYRLHSVSAAAARFVHLAATDFLSVARFQNKVLAAIFGGFDFEPAFSLK